MKILVISTTLLKTPPEGYGGIEVLVYYLVRELEKLGHKVTLAAAHGSYEPNNGLIEASRENEIANLIDPDDYDVIHDWSHSKVSSKLLHPKVFSTPFWTDAKGANPIYPTKAVAHVFGEPNAPVVYPGISVEKYPLIEDKEDSFIPEPKKAEAKRKTFKIKLPSFMQKK